jgi:hypothetical protein
MFMEVKRMNLRSTIGRLPFALLLLSAMPLAAQGNCQPVFDALSKVSTTSTHIYVAMNAVPNGGDKPRTIETIYAAGAIYTRVGGKWNRSPITPQQVVKQERENRQRSNFTCRYLRDESVNGETAGLYSTHAETADQKSDGQIWISKTRGLPLRQEIDIDTGGKTGKNHSSMRYEYGNVQPPQEP